MCFCFLCSVTFYYYILSTKDVLLSCFDHRLVGQAMSRVVTLFLKLECIHLYIICSHPSTFLSWQMWSSQTLSTYSYEYYSLSFLLSSYKYPKLKGKYLWVEIKGGIVWMHNKEKLSNPNFGRVLSLATNCCKSILLSHIISWSPKRITNERDISLKNLF